MSNRVRESISRLDFDFCPLELSLCSEYVRENPCSAIEKITLLMCLSVSACWLSSVASLTHSSLISASRTVLGIVDVRKANLLSPSLLPV